MDKRRTCSTAIVPAPLQRLILLPVPNANTSKPSFVRKLLKDRKIVLDLTEGARKWLGRVGYDPVYGARPLKRAVQRYVQDPLADMILSGKVPDGSTVKIDEGDGSLEMQVT